MTISIYPEYHYIHSQRIANTLKEHEKSWTMEEFDAYSQGLADAKSDFKACVRQMRDELHEAFKRMNDLIDAYEEDMLDGLIDGMNRADELSELNAPMPPDDEECG